MVSGIWEKYLLRTDQKLHKITYYSMSNIRNIPILFGRGPLKKHPLKQILTWVQEKKSKCDITE